MRMGCISAAIAIAHVLIRLSKRFPVESPCSLASWIIRATHLAIAAARADISITNRYELELCPYKVDRFYRKTDCVTNRAI